MSYSSPDEKARPSVKVAIPHRPESAARKSRVGGLDDEVRSFFLVGPLTVGLALTTLILPATGATTVGLAFLLIATSTWYIVIESRVFNGLTFTSCFVGISAFVFGFRALYIGFNDDFSIISTLGLVRSQSVIIGSMRYVICGMVAYLAGACSMTNKAIRERNIRGRRFLSDMAAIDLGAVFIYAQIALTVILAAFSGVGARSSLYESYDSAYIYLLPTLVHGFDLYFFTHILVQWWRSRNPLNAVLLGLCGAIIFVHAYLLSYLSSFRSYYLVGLLVCTISVVIVTRKKIGAWVLLAVVAIYPMFKAIGIDRDLSARDLLSEVVMRPIDAYSGHGIEVALGEATDLNMLDTFAASLNWQHSYRGYVLSYLYPFVHWVPRSWWPSKPTNGVLSDTGYVYVAELAREIPYSPGLIGFFNDDGGKVYMIGMMFVLGVFMRYWEIFAMRQKGQEMYTVIWAALLLSSIVSVRYLPYQIFYQFLTLFLPCWLCNCFVPKRKVAEQRW